MQNDEKLLAADNFAPFYSMKLISAGEDGTVKKRIIDITASTVNV